MRKLMCQWLSNADINAIRKARGFPGKETAAREIFETYLLSNIGVEDALTTLSDEEIALLHLLNRLDIEVGIDFFGRVYGEEGRGRSFYYGTPTQRYRETFAQVQKNLIRRGILLCAEDPGSTAGSKIERWRFRFPPEFGQYLPPIIRSPHRSGKLGEFKSSLLRQKLLELIDGPSPSPLRGKSRYRLEVVDGNLKLDGRPFQAGLVLEWQEACWEAEAKMYGIEKPPQAFSPLEAVISVFSLLGEQEWILPQALTTPINIFCNSPKVPMPEEICAAGWRWGCLSRLIEDGITYYHLPAGRLELDSARETPPQAYIQVDNQRTDVAVDLQAIPLDHLECLSQIADLSLAGRVLLAAPNRVKIGRAIHADLEKHPLLLWLKANSTAFGEAIRDMQERWGKCIVHSGLWIARVRDLSLKVQIERLLDGRGQLVSLSDEYLAFPAALQPEIERLVKKAGFVVKMVQAK